MEYITNFFPDHIRHYERYNISGVTQEYWRYTVEIYWDTRGI
jgi:hypothetical protein